jgi:transcription factor IIIB subunit 1
MIMQHMIIRAVLPSGLQRVRALCRILRLSYDVEELAEVYFRQAYTHASFIHVTLAKKEALVGCCVLVSCRLRNWPLALGTISGLVETDPALVGGVFKQLEKVLDVEVPKSSITYVLEAHSRE